MAIEIEPTTILGPSEGIGEHQAVNLTRNNKGSRWDRIGNNELISADQWRYVYDPLTGVPKGRALMGQWTNEILDPRDMTTGNWTGFNSVSISRDAIGIDGESNTACTLTDGNSSGVAGVFSDSITISDDSSTHTGVVLIAKDSDTSRLVRIRLTFTGGTRVDYDLWLNTSTGDITAEGSASSSDVSISDDGTYWEIAISGANNNSGNTGIRMEIAPAAGTTAGSTDNSTTGSCIADVAGLFLNRSSPPPTPVYGETAGQSYTQDPDIPVVTDLDSINFNPQEGTFVTEIVPTVTDADDLLFVTEMETSGDPFQVYLSSDNLRIFTGSTLSIPIANERSKISFGYTDSEVFIVYDGTIETQSANIGTVSKINIGCDDEDSRQLNGFMGEFLNYPRRLTNQQLIDESTL